MIEFCIAKGIKKDPVRTEDIYIYSNSRYKIPYLLEIQLHEAAKAKREMEARRRGETKYETGSAAPQRESRKRH